MEKVSKLEPDESFETISKTLRPLKAIAKILGIMLVFFGLIVTVLSYAFPYLLDNGYTEAELELYSQIAFAVGFTLFGGGLGLSALVSIFTLPNDDKIEQHLNNFYKDKEKPKTSVRFFSFRWSRLLAAICFLTLGFLDLFIITGAMSHHNPPFGTAIVLGGPSFYYVIALFPHGFGLGLLLYTLFFSHKVDIGSSENFLYYNEFKKNSRNHAALSKKEIETVRYQNTHIGKNHVWIIILVPMIALTAIQGVYLLMAPFLQNPTEGILFIVTAILEVVALYFLALRPAQYLKITTKENYYETWFAPNLKELEIPLSDESGKGKISSEFLENNNINPTHRIYLRLLVGLFFCISGLIMLIFYYVVGVFGGMYTMASVIFGTILIIQAISNDFSEKDGVIIDYDQNDKTFRFEQNFRSRFLRINTLQSTEVEVKDQFRKVTIFEILVLSLVLVYSMIETVQSWAISSSTNMILNSVITTIFLCVVYFLIFLYLCVPTNHLQVRTPTMKYNVPVTLKNQKKGFLEGVLSDDLKKSFTMRCLYLLIAGVGTLIGTLIYLNIFFFV